MYRAQLDDRQFVTLHDRHGMLGIYEGFPDQCRSALKIGREAFLPRLSPEPRLVCLTGMGGSAAGGDIAKALFDAYADVPFIVNRDYHLPHYVRSDSLVFCVSYSGNTEETLSAYRDAQVAGATVIAITSGGRLAQLAKKDGIPLLEVPAGLAPRAALGSMLIPLLLACQRLDLIPEQDFEAAFDLLDACASKKWAVGVSGSNVAKELAEACHRKLIVLYGLGGWQGAVANRWKGQINENSKVMAFANTYPELDHNEILGWVGSGDQGVKEFVGILLQDGGESAKMKARAQVSSEIIGEKCRFVDAFAEGTSLLERILTLTHIADYVSLYLAALNGVDPENIDAIDQLKIALSGIPEEH